VDPDGHLQVSLRDSIAAPLTQAFTAGNFDAATSVLAGRADSPVGRIDGLSGGQGAGRRHRRRRRDGRGLRAGIEKVEEALDFGP